MFVLDTNNHLPCHYCGAEPGQEHRSDCTVRLSIAARPGVDLRPTPAGPSPRFVADEASPDDGGKAERFGRLLRRTCETYDLCPHCLAEDAGLDLEVMDELGRGDRLPTSAELRALGAAFGQPLYVGGPPTVNVRVGDEVKEIDEAMAPLIVELHRAGIETIVSGEQDNWGMAWVEFADPEGLATFLSAVAGDERGPDTLYERITFARTIK